MNIKNYCLCFVILCFCACAREEKAVLADVESFINDRPDSALAVLRDLKEMPTKRLKAKNALLHSMALDKCYIDLQTDSILAPAVKYYSCHGSSDERLKMCYYRARISENAKQPEEAIAWLVKGERFVNDCEDYAAAGRLYTSKATQYFNSYHLEEALRNEELALPLFKKSGNLRLCTMSVLNLADSHIALGHYDEAKSLLDSLMTDLPTISLSQKIRFCRSYARASLSRLESIPKCLDLVYENIPYPDRYPNLEMARCYASLQQVDSAAHFLSLFAKGDTTTLDRAAYSITKSDVLALSGDYREAFKNERNFVSYELNDLYERLQSEILFVEERTASEYESRLARIRSSVTILILVLSLVVLVLLVCLVNNHLKQKSEENKRLKEQFSTLIEEKETLQGLYDSSDCLSAKMKELLANRIEQIEKVLLMRKMAGKAHKDIAILKLDELVGNQHAFLVTLSLLYSVCHPVFINYLNSHNLSDSEIGYCCLYVLGLDSKDVVSLLETTNAYNTNASIRKKLGISKKEIHLPEYLRSIHFES